MSINHAPEPSAHAELNDGLLALQPYIAPKYLYDILGSRLFTAICELDEYYPTRTEAAIFDAHLQEIAASIGTGATLIDLGAGDCKKAERLLPVLQPREYVAVDISTDFLEESLQRLRSRSRGIAMQAVALDFSESLDLPESVRRDKRLFFYPGSSIGNFSPDKAVHFLRRLHAACKVGSSTEGGLLIGVDLVKNKSVLTAAYDDALGVTAAFNLNILRHLNRLLDADFRVEDWRHKACFNAEQSCIEMHLVAQVDITVHWRDGQRRFERGQFIHTENSYKYTQKGFLALLEKSGFGKVRIWSDPQGWFMVCHAQAM
jgi:dimethylhistidine N-methyltransferase